ncbi:MAG: NADP-dependent phosphogluconate dehydrogenase [Candidatus Kariarchaeaceae archaeon]|jgi:6-phosphogluconate dehydrogenase
MNSIGIIGMAVMGQNLALNMADKNYDVAVFNRSPAKTKEFAKNRYHERITPFFNIKDFIKSLSSPRKILLMIKAGEPVDMQIEEIVPFLDDNDIIIDGGNSNYKDTQRRYAELKLRKIEFIGAGISGGEEGARYGPSIMPGGSNVGWESVKDIFLAISAKAKDGLPCCTWLGLDGSGHFVKTVHNGIEYGDMQLIGEVFHIMRDLLKMNLIDISNVFKQWNKGKLNSFLIEITYQILRKKDNLNGDLLLSKVLDVAQQKGTGRWTVDAAMDFGEPVSLISQAVFQRILSSHKSLRETATGLFKPDKSVPENIESKILEKLENALYVSKIISYVQGFQLLKAGSANYKWNFSLGNIASIWRNGCIIRSQFLDEITNAYQNNPDLENFIFAEYFENVINRRIGNLREIISFAITNKIPVPGLCAAISYFDSITTINLPTNLIQAQRDYFGAHGYQRIDTGSNVHHSKWDSN